MTHEYIVDTSGIEAKEPVSRSRRYRFIVGVVVFCLICSVAFTGAAGLGLFSYSAALIEMLVASLISLATATTLAYIGGSVVDYNGGIMNLFSTRSITTHEAKG